MPSLDERKLILEATKPYLEYLDKEMTIQGVLATFCMLAAGVLMDRVLGAKHGDASEIMHGLQTIGLSYFVAGVLLLTAAAWLFYLQRSELARVHGDLSRATTRTALEKSNPSDSPSLDDALAAGDTWALWRRYQWGLLFLASAAAEMVAALARVIIWPTAVILPIARWITLVGPLVLGTVVLVAWQFTHRDSKPERASEPNRKRAPSDSRQSH